MSVNRAPNRTELSMLKVLAARSPRGCRKRTLEAHVGVPVDDALSWLSWYGMVAKGRGVYRITERGRHWA